MNNGLLYLGSLLALVLAVLFGAPFFIDWNGYRGVFEEEATKVLGRDVRVGGAVNVRFLPTPYVRFEKVRLADTTGQTGEPFLRAESFTMRLAVSPLLRGALEANDIELNKPVLSLVVDGEGGGNWSSLTLKPAELPFIPADVMLHAVRLIDGTLSVHRADGGGISRVEAINGELSADTLQGPFKFKGSAKAGGIERGIKFATLAADGSGSVRLKASMHALGESAANSYAFDGAIEDFTGRPRIAGELTGKLLLPKPVAADGAADKEPAPFLNLKTAVEADARGAAFDAIELDLDAAAEPQIITGKATASWSGEARMDTVLAAKWLDLDLLAAPKGQQASFPGVKVLFMSLIDALAGEGAAAARIDVEQIRFGGEMAGSLIVDAERAGGILKLKRLKGGLPGGARFELTGSIQEANGAKTFSGDGAVRGINFARVQAFAQRSGIGVDVKAEGPFWVAGRVDFSENTFALTNAKAEIGGHPVSGEIAVDAREKRKISLRLESATLDSAMFFPAEARHVDDALRQALGFEARGGAAAGEAVPGTQPAAAAATSTSVRLLTGELKHDGRSYKNVDATILIDGAGLVIPAATFTTSAGALVRTSGTIALAGAGAQTANAKAKGGVISYEIEAPQGAALSEAGDVFGVSALVPKAQLARVPSVRMAGLVRLGKRLPSSADVTFDGLAGGARISGEAAFDQGFRSWRSAHARINAVATAPSMSALYALLGQSPGTLKSLEARAGEAQIVISGSLADGAPALAEIKAEGLAASLQGTLTSDAAKGYRYAGRGTIDAEEAREALALAGIATPAGLAGTALKGTIDVANSDAGLTLASEAIKAGSATLKGRVALNGAGSGAESGAGSALVLDGDVEADRLTVAGLLGWLTDAGQRPSSANSETPATPDDSASAVWPEAQFSFDALGALTGKVRLKTAALELGDGLVARDARASVVLSPGKVSLDGLQARAGTGTVDLAAEIEKSPVGATLTAKLGLAGDIANFNPGATGRAALTFSGTGRALSPATVISALSGKGTLKLDDVRHPGPAPVVVADASDAVMSGKLENDAGILAPALAAALGSAQVVPGSRELAFAVSGGDVKLDAYTVEGPQGSARVTTTVSLSSLLVDSSWEVAAIASPLPPPPEAGPDWKPAPKGSLPPVSFVYTGPLGDLAQLQVNVDAAALQRELEVRKMERKVEELDVLRKREEERQRQELERRKAIEAERAAAAAAAAAAAQAARAQAQQQRAAPAEQMPPVIPEANDSGAIVPQGETPPAPAAAEAPPASPPVTQIEIIPDPPVESAAGTAADAPAAATVPAAPRVTVAPRPQPQASPRPTRPRRTTSDELNKAFGGWP